jgi:hypothetical protein
MGCCAQNMTYCSGSGQGAGYTRGTSRAAAVLLHLRVQDVSSGGDAGVGGVRALHPAWEKPLLTFSPACSFHVAPQQLSLGMPAQQFVSDASVLGGQQFLRLAIR